MKHKGIFVFSHQEHIIWVKPELLMYANEAILRKTHILKLYLYIIRRKK